MALASVIVQPEISKIGQVTDTLTSLANVTIQTIAQAQIIVLIEAPTLKQLEELARKIENLDGVLGVYPVYVTTDDKDE